MSTTISILLFNQIIHLSVTENSTIKTVMYLNGFTTIISSIDYGDDISIRIFRTGPTSLAERCTYAKSPSGGSF